MKKILTWLFWAPFGLLVVTLAVANRHSVTFSIDPTSRIEPLYSVELPLFALLLGAVFFGLLIGGAASWINQGKWRKAAREGRTEAKHWRHSAEHATSSPSHDTSGPSGLVQLPSPDPR